MCRHGRNWSDRSRRTKFLKQFRKCRGRTEGSWDSEDIRGLEFENCALCANRSQPVPLNEPMKTVRRDSGERTTVRRCSYQTEALAICSLFLIFVMERILLGNFSFQSCSNVTQSVFTVFVVRKMKTIRQS